MISLIRRACAAGALLATLAVPAGAQVTYDFLAPLVGASGASNGNWTGYVTFNWLVSGGSGTGAATSFVTTAVPGNVGTPSQGWNATLWGNVASNSFTFLNGNVTAFQFGAISMPDDYRLCANSGAAFYLTSNMLNQCPEHYNRIGKLAGARGENWDGIDGITFTARVSTVPEPTTWALMASGLVAMGVVARRRKTARDTTRS